jgi:SAM-dependent methyltransferase
VSKLVSLPIPPPLADEEITAVDSVLLPSTIIDALREGRCPSDLVFDRFLPRALRLVSVTHFTPLVVARRAAEWIDELGIRSVVDIGSGAGKFCVAAALAGGARYLGIEHRRSLVLAARELARTFDIHSRVTFVHATFGLGQTPIPQADAYYLFNPFGENMYGPPDHIDEDVELNDDRYLRDVLAAESLLEDLPVGTYVITYNGFGGEMPPSFRELRVDDDLPNSLRLWRKTVSAHSRR